MSTGRLLQRESGPSYVRPEARRGILLAVLVVSLFGFFAVVVIDLLDYHTSIELAQRHLLIAGLVLFGAAARKGRLHPRGRLATLAALGCGMTVMPPLFFTALERLGAGPAITLQFVGVLAVMVWTHVVKGVRVPAVAWLAGLVTVLGISLVVEAWIWERVDLVGIAAGVGAALFLAIYLLVVDHLGGQLHPLTITAYPVGIAALLLMPLARWGPMDLAVSKWWWLVALGVFGTALPALLEVVAVRHAGPGPVGMIILIQPVAGALAAWFLLGQVLTGLQILGIAVSLVGVLLVQSRVSKARS